MIKIFTNHIPGGWSPLDLEKSLGGSEEAVVMLSRELAKEDEVIVYHSQKEIKELVDCGVTYLDRSKAQCDSDDVFITFKDKTPWINGARGKVNIHWTAEVEKPWDVSMLDAYVTISNFHKSRSVWVPSEKSIAIPLGVDIDSLERNKTGKDPHTLLYCSSPDRGLEVLLKDWPFIKERYPDMRLKVAYGFEMLKACARNSQSAIDYVDQMLLTMKERGIEYLGQLSKDEIEREYWKSSFWVLPLQNPESELFCLNAVKSSYSGSIPIVNKMGALKDTVGEYIDYKEFVKGKLETCDKSKSATYRAVNWSSIVSQYWKTLIQDE